MHDFMKFDTPQLENLAFKILQKFQNKNGGKLP